MIGRDFLTVYKNTIQKEMRRSSLWVMAFISLVSLIVIYSLFETISTSFLKEQSVGPLANIASLAFVHILGFMTGLIAIFFGADVIRSDEDQKTMGIMLALPVSRGEYYLARILGVLTIVLGFYLMFLVAMMVLLGDSEAVSFAGVPLALIHMSLRAFVVIALSTFLSLFVGKLPTFLLVSFFITFQKFAQPLADGASGIFAHIKNITYYVFPRLQTMNSYASSFVIELDIKENYYMELIHFNITTIVFLGIILAVFYRREV